MLYADEFAKCVRSCTVLYQAAGGLAELKGIAGAWLALEEAALEHDMQTAHEHDVQAAPEMSENSSSHAEWHAGFDIDSDGHWVPDDLEPFAWSAAGAQQSGAFSDWSDDS
jgi:hypothetical protein